MKRCSGLTLTELAIATTIVLVVASVAVPNAVSRRIAANEAAAVTALRDIADAQAKFRAAVAWDVDHDGVGEYGLLRELSGRVGVRTVSNASTQGAVLNPPLLADAFGSANGSHEYGRAGYLFHLALPGAFGDAIPEVSGTATLSAPINGEIAETTWCCYAWPKRYGRTGHRTFFINQTNEIVTTESHAYSGPRSLDATNMGAAFAAGGDVRNITGQVATGTVGRDGNFWRPVTARAEARRLVASGTFDWRVFFRGREGSFEFESRRSLTVTDETMVVRADGLEPRVTYWLLLQAPTSASPALFGKVLGDSQGRVTFRFDTGEDAYPDGVASLVELGGGWMSMVDANGTVLHVRIPEFTPRDARPMLEPSIDANEASAIAALRLIAEAQSTFQASGVIDWTGTGTGEFGMLRELSGRVGIRTMSNAATQGASLDVPLLPSYFGLANSYNENEHAGYYLHVILPGANGIGVLEVAGTSALAASIDSNLAETTWCCYAWPKRHGRTGRRTFFINELGDVVSTESERYYGTGDFTAQNAGAAFRLGGLPCNITGQVATGTVGRDGNLWRSVPTRTDEHVFTVRGAGAPSTVGSSASATFTIEAKHLLNRTDESIDVRCADLAPRTTHRVLLTNAARTLTADFGALTTDGRGRATFLFDSRSHAFPDGVASLTELGGGTLEIADGNAVVLRGAIPEFATVRGGAVPGSTVVFHATKPFDATPEQLPRRGTLDVRVTNESAGRTEVLTITVTTYDRASGPFAVVAIDDQDAETLLGAIDVKGLTAAGTLVLDSRVAPIAGGGVVALSGRRIEVRTATGFVVLTGTLPVVE